VTTATHELATLAHAVAGPGVDPQRVARLVAWCLTPGRTADTLRRGLAADEVSPRLPDAAQTTGGRADALDAALPPVPADRRGEVAAVLDAWRRAEVRVATIVDDAYPSGLGAGWPGTAAPLLLAWRGVAPATVRTRGPAVAIVGARRATGYGTGVGAWLAEAAGRAGVRVVSGGALGIDAAAHLAALETAGGTTVVLGCGHAVRYPRPHAGPDGLFDRVVQHGGSLLSELLPHAPAHPGNVRARNRIVAGLVDVVVVVEGGARSGSLVTATAAADAGVPVLAVPGDVRAPGSVAPHRLLAEGAAPCTSPADLLEALGHGSTDAGADARRTARVAVSVLPEEVHRILVAAWPRPVPVDELAAATGRSAPALLGALTRARIAGETSEDVSGVRLRRAPP
jgi:DNA processing protein